MSISNIPTRRKQKPPELPKVERFQSKKIVSLKNKNKWPIGKKTKTIKGITDLIDKQADFSNIHSCKKSLNNYIKTKKINIWNYPKQRKRQYFSKGIWNLYGRGIQNYPKKKCHVSLY